MRALGCTCRVPGPRRSRSIPRRRGLVGAAILLTESVRARPRARNSGRDGFNRRRGDEKRGIVWERPPHPKHAKYAEEIQPRLHLARAWELAQRLPVGKPRHLTVLDMACLSRRIRVTGQPGQASRGFADA